MKRLTIVTATIAALAVATTPAFADNNGKGQGPKKQATKQVSVEINGTVKTVADTSTVTVVVKTSSQPKALKELTKTLKDATITVKSDTKTVVKRNGATVALGNLMVGDKVNLRALCSVVSAKVVCVASRVTSAGVKPSPSASPAIKGFDLELRGTVVSNSAGVNGRVLGVTASAAEVGHDATFKPKSILGTTVTIYTDSATVVTRAGLTVNADTLTGNPVVSIEAMCTPASPAVCTAKRITVIVPTA